MPSSVPPPNDMIKWTVAGRGDRGPRCGHNTEYVCPHCQKQLVIEHSCMLRTCPKCFRLWHCREAAITRDRMNRAARVFNTRLHHVILSFKEVDINEMDKQDYNRFRNGCYDLLKRAGASGGGLVLHPWREDHDGDFTVPGLHCHAFVVGRWLSPGNEIETNGDILFKRIGELRYYKQYKYVFEHCGVSEGIHSITWYGSMSYRNFPKDDKERRGAGHGRGVNCPECQTNMEPLVIIDWVARDEIHYSIGKQAG